MTRSAARKAPPEPKPGAVRSLIYDPEGPHTERVDGDCRECMTGWRKFRAGSGCHRAMLKAKTAPAESGNSDPYAG